MDAESREAAVRAARAAADRQALDVRVLDVGRLLQIVDYFVIASGRNDRQVKAIAEAVERELREGEGERKPVRREGEREARWVLLDYVDVVVHVFLEEERDYYELERLWRDAPVVEWEDVAPGDAGRAAGEAGRASGAPPG